MKNFKQAYDWSLSHQNINKYYKTEDQGLSHSQASQRLLTNGPNKLKSKSSSLKIITSFLRQFLDYMIILLLISSALSLYLQDYKTALILLILVVVNSAVGFIQEFKADQTLKKLASLSAPKARVFRDGQLLETESDNLVCGDVVRLEAGDGVPADCRIIEESNLEANEFALTGESSPTRKTARALKNNNLRYADQRNMLFMGTTIAVGECRAVVVKTGQQTALGTIAEMTSSTRRELSPLQIEMNHTSKVITAGTIILSITLSIIALITGMEIKAAFLFALGVASAMIPQGLPAEVNVSLSRASAVLAKNKALVKKLSAVDGLGSTTVICTDKTGTLTKNQMTAKVMAVFDGEKLRQIDLPGTGYNTEIDRVAHHFKSQEQIAYSAIFACNSAVLPPDDEHQDWYVVGDPTEGAMLVMASKLGFSQATLNAKYREVKEYSFDSERKMMSSVRLIDGRNYLYLKGSPDSVVNLVTKVMTDDGRLRKITENDKKLINNYCNQQSDLAHRNIALAYRELSEEEFQSDDPEAAEKDLCLLAITSLIDPPRDEVKQAMIDMNKSHIKVNIVTGDAVRTASAIANMIGMHTTKLLTGNEVAEMNDRELQKTASRGGVIFARVNPNDKMRIVSLLEDKGEVVAVTGDGINDAPALKKADIGVAMGFSGTEVAKDASDIVLLDDSFATMSKAVILGRLIYNNIVKSTLSCLSSNSGELVTVLISLAFSITFDFPLAITAVLILAIDLMAELFPISALSWDKAQDDLLTKHPRRPDDHILNKSNIKLLLLTGTLMGVLAYATFIAKMYFSDNAITIDSPIYGEAIALTYVCLVLMQYVNILIKRDSKFFINSYLWSNKQLLWAYLVSFVGVLSIIYVPAISDLFGTDPLGIADWLVALAVASIFGLLLEVYKHRIIFVTKIKSIIY